MLPIHVAPWGEKLLFCTTLIRGEDIHIKSLGEIKVFVMSLSRSRLNIRIRYLFNNKLKVYILTNLKLYYCINCHLKVTFYDVSGGNTTFTCCRLLSHLKCMSLMTHSFSLFIHVYSYMPKDDDLQAVL